MPQKRASGKRKSRRVFSHRGKHSKTVLRAGLYARVLTNDQQASDIYHADAEGCH
jgi:hypothetical protein